MYGNKSFHFQTIEVDAQQCVRELTSSFQKHTYYAYAELDTKDLSMELIAFRAADGMELHGALHPAGSPTDRAAVFLHGAGSNFYGCSLLKSLRPMLDRLGCGLFSINTRGHDLACTLRAPQGGRWGGAAFETVDECRHDIRGAIDCLVERGHRRIALIGHSLGALKAIYSQAFDPHDTVSHIVAISPPRLSYEAFARGPRRREFLTLMSRAKQLVAAGEGEHLLHVTIPLPLLITAAGYVDKYGPAERYNLLRFTANVIQPMQLIFGQQEVTSQSEAFGGLDETLRQLVDEHQRDWLIRVIPNADHFYTGCSEALTAEIERWPGWRS